MTKYYEIGAFKNAVKENALRVKDELITTDIEGKAAYIVVHISRKKIHLMRRYLLSGERPLISDDFNAFEWLENDYKSTLPEVLQEIVKIGLLKEINVFGSNQGEAVESGRQWKYFKNTKHRIATYKKNDVCSRWWWLGTQLSASRFAFANRYGHAAGHTPSYSRVGLRPHLSIKRSDLI